MCSFTGGPKRTTEVCVEEYDVVTGVRISVLPLVCASGLESRDFERLVTYLNSRRDKQLCNWGLAAESSLLKRLYDVEDAGLVCADVMAMTRTVLRDRNGPEAAKAKGLCLSADAIGYLTGATDLAQVQLPLASPHQADYDTRRLALLYRALQRGVERARADPDGFKTRQASSLALLKAQPRDKTSRSSAATAIDAALPDEDAALSASESPAAMPRLGSMLGTDGRRRRRTGKETGVFGPAVRSLMGQQDAAGGAPPPGRYLSGGGLTAALEAGAAGPPCAAARPQQPRQERPPLAPRAGNGKAPLPSASALHSTPPHSPSTEMADEFFPLGAARDAELALPDDEEEASREAAQAAEEALAEHSRWEEEKAARGYYPSRDPAYSFY